MKITYDDKISLTNSPLPRANKCTDDDLNEIKEVVNNNDDTTNQNSSDIQILQNNVETLNDKTNLKYCIATTTTASNLGSNFQVLLNKIERQQGNVFTISNNVIVVGAGITKVRASASIFVEAPQNTGYVWGKITRARGTHEINTNTCIMPYNNGGGFLSVSISPSIMNVEEGDVIKLIADSTCQGNLRTGFANTWILVEAIE